MAKITWNGVPIDLQNHFRLAELINSHVTAGCDYSFEVDQDVLWSDDELKRLIDAANLILGDRVKEAS